MFKFEILKLQGSNRGLRAFGVVQLIGVASSDKDKTPSTLAVRRLLRPEEVSSDLAYRSSLWDLYMPVGAAGAPFTVSVQDVVGKVSVVLRNRRQAARGEQTNTTNTT
jgi:hypothetical protein